MDTLILTRDDFNVEVTAIKDTFTINVNKLNIKAQTLFNEAIYKLSCDTSDDLMRYIIQPRLMDILDSMPQTTFADEQGEYEVTELLYGLIVEVINGANKGIH